MPDKNRPAIGGPVFIWSNDLSPTLSSKEREKKIELVFLLIAD